MASWSGLPSPALAQPWEWIIFLIIVALLLLFGPAKLPEFARSIGRAWGEFRRGKLEVERELRQELAQAEGAEVAASKDEVLRAARELAVTTEGRDLGAVKLDIAREIDRAEPSRIVTIAKTFGIGAEGVSSQSLKEQIIRRLHV